MKIEEIEALQTPEGIQFLQEHIDESPDALLLKYSGKVSADLLRGSAEQLKCRSRLKSKQPAYYDAGALAELSLLEQSTPHEVAEFRKQILSGTSLCECTGGMGVDTLALSQVFDSVEFCEIDPARAEMFRCNLNRFPSKNITLHVGDSMEFLRTSGERYEWLFLDPARRDGTGKRFITLDLCMPNVIAEAQLLRDSADNIAIKLSPAFEITELPQLFPDISRCLVISLNGEVREILVTVEKGRFFSGVEAVVLNSSEYFLTDDNLGSVEISDGSEKILFEPDPAIIKAGLIDSLARRFGLKRWSSRGVFLRGNEIIPEFPGRQFTLQNVEPWQRKRVGKYLRDHNIPAAAIIRRDFPLKPEELRKQFKLGESDCTFLIFTSDFKDKRVMIHAEKWYK